MFTIKLYSNDFKKFHYWNQICDSAGVDSNCDKLVLTISNAEGFIDANHNSKKKSLVKIYSEDFTKLYAWNQTCVAAGVDSNCNQLVLTVVKAEGFIEADQEEIEEEEDLF